MTRSALIIALALAACVDPPHSVEEANDAVEKTVERAKEKAREDVKIVAQGTADEAKRVAEKTAQAAEDATSKVAERVDAAGSRIDNAADQVGDIAKDGVPEPAPPDEVRAAMQGVDDAIDCDGAGKCTVTRDFAARMRERPDVLAAQARLEAAPDGKGVRMQNLGDLPRGLGFQHGDVVTAINDVPLTGNYVPALVLQMGASSFEIQFVRGGSEHTLQIDVV
jgi:vacuolar-type H+-ATPase subunit H